MTLNIANLANAQAMGWADAPITRKAAGCVGMPALSLTQGTITTDVKALDIVSTWNNAAITFTAIKANITDTASNAASLLLDLQVGGTHRLSLTKAGRFSLGLSGAANAFRIDPVGSGTTDIYNANGAYMLCRWSTASFSIGNSISMGAVAAAPDIQIERDAANILALRRTTNAQAFRVYNTYTDASNYERGFMRWSSNELQIGAEAGGTGASRTVRIQGPSDVLLSVTNGTGNIVGFYTSTGVALITARGNQNISLLGALLSITSLPTSDPAVSGRIWNDAGTLKVSP